MRRATQRALTAVIAAISMTIPTGASSAVAAAAPTLPGRAATVGLGERGAPVTPVQQALIAAGVPLAGGADGWFGPATRRALVAFQTARGLPGSGSVDATTSEQLGLRLPAKGERGAAVQRAQELLIAAGLTPLGGADGIFGPSTEATVRRFQETKGLTPTGALDDATAVALGMTPQPPGVIATVEAATASATATRGTATADAPATQAPAQGAFVRIGDRGAGVTRVQQALISAGVDLLGGADGVFGNATASALVRYQTGRGLHATGAMDQPTASALGLALPRLGERGDAVKRLQQMLLTAGIALAGGADGIFGPVTAGAIGTYQTVNGLPGSGVLDDATAVKLGFAPTPTPIGGGQGGGGQVGGGQGAAPAPTPTPEPPPSVSIGQFPVQGPCTFIDTWLQVRSGGRVHQGVDIITAEGRYVYAVADGTISKRYWDYPGALTGNGLRLSLADGTYFFYAHLLDVAPGIEVGTKVKQGQIIGFVGETGNAGTPHLHFEVHPKGGSAINPYPVVKVVDACKVTDPPPQPA